MGHRSSRTLGSCALFQSRPRHMAPGVVHPLEPPTQPWPQGHVTLPLLHPPSILTDFSEGGLESYLTMATRRRSINHGALTPGSKLSVGSYGSSMTGQDSSKRKLVNQKLQVQSLRIWFDILNWVPKTCHYFYIASLNFSNW